MLSVIIPTYNRADILKRCLENLMTQKEIEFEIILVDDGSSDQTEQVIQDFTIPEDTGQKWMDSKLISFKPLRQYNARQAVARNRGGREAEGDIILFIGDDILVEPHFFKKHLEAHEKHPDENVVVLGYSTWSPGLEWAANKDQKVEVNDYMRFLENSGWQFGYGFLKPGFVTHSQPYKFFYTSNISMKRSFFQKEWFNEKFTAYGWEDMELGYRLWKNHDMKLFYEPDAKAYHHHFLPESDLPKKMQAIGKSAVQFQGLHPEVWVVPRGLKKWLIKIATNPLTLPLTRWFGKNTYFKFKSWREFFAGVKSAKNPADMK